MYDWDRMAPVILTTLRAAPDRSAPARSALDRLDLVRFAPERLAPGQLALRLISQPLMVCRASAVKVNNTAPNSNQLATIFTVSSLQIEVSCTRIMRHCRRKIAPG